MERRIEWARRRWAVALAVAILLALSAFAGTAAAHFLYESGAYVKDPTCVSGGSGIHESPNQAIAEVWTEAAAQGVCWTPKRYPPGWLAVGRHLYKWSGTEWYICAWSGWHYSTGFQHYHSNYGEWANMPCGTGWYNSLAHSYAFFAGQWLGGARFAGNHYF